MVCSSEHGRWQFDITFEKQEQNFLNGLNNSKGETGEYKFNEYVAPSLTLYTNLSSIHIRKKGF